jgi:hypothetical protein
MMSGGYRKAPQRDAGITDQGGETDVALPGQSRWTQDDFTGGMYQDNWGRDAAQFKYCSGFRPLPYSRGLVTVPPVIEGIKQTAVVPAVNWSGTNYRTYPAALVFVHAGYLYVVYPGGDVIAYFDLDGGIGGISSLPNVTADQGNVACWHRESATLYVSDDGNGVFRRITLSNGVPSAASPASYTYPTAVGSRSCTGMNADGPRITCLFEKMIVDLTVPDTATAAVGAGSKQWAVNRRYHLPSQFRDAIFFNSQLYILCTDANDPYSVVSGGYSGGWLSSIVAWDGADLFPVVNFPYAFRGQTMVEYAGRVYVGGASLDLGGTGEAFGEIFEITGSSLRSLKSWAPDSRSVLGGAELGPPSINDLVVYEGALWFYNLTEDRLDHYDVTTDSFYGGPDCVIADNSIVKLVPLGETLGVYSNVFDFEDAVPPGDQQDAVLSWVARSGEETGTYNPNLITSDFIFEPAKDKRFTEIVVLTKGGGVDALEYSTDGGDSYTAASTVAAATTQGNWTTTRFDLTPMTPAKRASFKIQLELTTAEDQVELVAFSTSFSILHSGKSAWTFTVVGAEQIEGYNGEKFSQDVADIEESLSAWMTAGTKLVFTDLNGVNYNVTVYDFEESQVEIGPKVAFADGTRPEALFGVTLVEM